ncbi:uncharacterized protein K444DRAFT_2985 [Hyaloscypha bicolor E]|uniref:Ankyrin n=1 Tax=Hyaloscypha bicolor E TaxID=1095630 RepID=A0A2J6TVC5_9HELO|nr:uncharacterized protein K444DRAFT_2985 [Hyaloscypha bicolor E]PMD66970.1 hypothetical protein K444DRAFT_2985 [Hyaloscypha bicolor E]
MGQKVSKRILEVAATRENTRMLKLLLHTVEEMKMQDSVLEAAITKGRPKIFQMLLQHGLEDPILEASLCRAASEDDNLEMIIMLLAHTKGEDSATGDILQAVLGEAVDESSMSIVELLLENRFVTQFLEHIWSKVVAQKNVEIVEILLKLDPRFEVTENVLKHAIKSSNVKTLKLLLLRDPQIKIHRE